jgi:putative ABC transport system permease protein
MEIYYNDITPLFVLKEPKDLEIFKIEMSQYLPENYKFTDNSSSYESISAPMENMSWIASIVLYVSLGATLVILSLLITLFLRDRKHEIGIYLSLGEKKKNVIMQIVMEVLCVSFIAITLSVFSGNLIAGLMSEQMLENQIIAEKNANNQSGISNLIMRAPSRLDMLGYTSNYTAEELMDAYSVKLGFRIIILFYLVGLGSILLSTLVPIIYVIRLNPKKIMM